MHCRSLAPAVQRTATWSLGVAALAVVVLQAASPLCAQETEVVVGADSNWTYFKGEVEPPADWNTLNFDDFDWLEGKTPIGYSSDITYTTVLNDMRNGYLSVYTRTIFTVDFPEQVKQLTLRMRYDDGFIAYINGVEVARLSMPGAAGTPVPYNTTANSHETNATFQSITLPCEAMAALEPGENVLAIQGHNTNLTSSDFTLDVELETSTAGGCPTAFQGKVMTDGERIRLTWGRPTGVVFSELKILRNGKEVDPPLSNPSLRSYTDTTPEPGDNKYELVATTCGEECSVETTVTLGPQGVEFRRGDSDDNGDINLTDAVFILLYLFRGGTEPSCLDAADTNDDGQVNLTDAVYLLQGLFQGGEAPPAPGDTCGAEPASSEDGLSPCNYTSC